MNYKCQHAHHGRNEITGTGDDRFRTTLSLSVFISRCYYAVDERTTLGSKEYADPSDCKGMPRERQ